MHLNNRQIRTLRSESHRLQLKPVVMIGQNGLSENVKQELEQALLHHELIKIRLPAMDKPGKQELITEMCKTVDAELIQSIGHVIVVYRRNPQQDRFGKLL